MKKMFIMLVAFFILCGTCIAEDIYVAQTAAGANTGVNCANANSLAWLNTAGNWGAGAGKVSGGDTVHFCGTFTSKATAQGSGSSGSVITLKFENNAKFSSTAWGADTAAAIVISGKHYITVDGGTNGVIENTDNGTGLGSQLNSDGVYLLNSDHITVSNLTIQNIYRRTPYSQDSVRFGRGISTVNVSNLSIHDNKIKDAEYGIYSYISLTKDACDIYNNDISRVATGIVVALVAAVNWTNVNIYNNNIYDQYVWDGCWGGTGADLCTGGTWNHSDGIHTWGNYAGGNIGPLKIYNNKIGGDFGNHMTSTVFLEDYNTPTLVYNNILYSDAGKGSPTNGYIYYASKYVGSSLKAYNNTIKGSGGGSGIEIANAATKTADIKNNIFTNVYVAIYNPAGVNATILSDYNVFFGNQNIYAWSNSLTSWQTALGGCPGVDNECNSMIADPRLASDFTLSYNSPAKDAGVNLSSNFTTDKAGFTRYHGYGWDIGAYEYNNPEPPRNLKIKAK